MYGLTLETTHCPDGVELDAGKVFRYRTKRRFPLKLETYYLENPFIIAFINADDDDALARFFGQFGFLEPGAAGHARADVQSSQRTMRKLLTLAGSDQAKEAANALNSRLGDTLSDTGVVPAMEGRRLSLKLQSLFALMRMEAVMVAEKDARLTACEHCETAFLTGATTGRRSHALYCSDRCRMAAMRARQAS